MSQPPRFPTLALVILATAIFTNISVEMLPMGLVLPMSRELGVTEGQIGLLVSAFAFIVVASSSLLVRVTQRIPRHVLVVIVLVLFGLTCLGTAIAPTYETVMLARVLGGLAHGVFWTVVGGYAAYLVPSEQLGRAVGITSAGGSLAFVLGLPLATALGQSIGWRATFAAFGVLCLVCAVLVWWRLPRVDHLRHLATTATGSVAVPVPGAKGTVSGIAVVIAATAISMTGQYALYTYIAPFLVQQARIPEVWLSPAIGAYGLMGALAVILMTVWLGRRPLVWLMVLLIATAGAMVLLATGTSVPVVFAAVLIWALAMGAVPPLLNTRLLQITPERLVQPTMAWYTAGFNFGIGFGALLGALLTDTVGVGVLPWTLAAGVTIAVVLLAASARGGLSRRTSRRRSG